MAIELSTEVKKRLQATQESFIETGSNNAEKKPGCKEAGLIRPANMHLTLRFLGEIDADRAEKIGAALEKRLATESPFEISTESIVLKGNKTLWVGIKKNPALDALKEAVDTELYGLGTKREPRAFTPHLTLMRVRSPERARRIRRRLKEISPTQEIDIKVGGVQLIESKLGTGPAVHSVIRECAFKN